MGVPEAVAAIEHSSKAPAVAGPDAPTSDRTTNMANKNLVTRSQSASPLSLSRLASAACHGTAAIFTCAGNACSRHPELQAD